MNKEELEELKDFTIDLTDIDELALGLEVCSKKWNMVIQEFADTIIQLQQENKQLKDNWNKLKEYLENKIDEYSINLEYLSAERMTQIKNKMQELEGSDSNE